MGTFNNNFNVADQSGLPDYTQVGTGTFDVVSNQVSFTEGANCTAVSTTQAASATVQYSEIDIVNPLGLGGQVGAHINGDNTTVGNGYSAVYVQSIDSVVIRKNGSELSGFIDVNATSGTHRIGIYRNGSDIRLYWDDVERIQVTDTGPTGLFCGMHSEGAFSCVLDNNEGGDWTPPVIPVEHVTTGSKSAGGTTTVAPAWSGTTVADEMGVAFRNVWPGTATLTAESLWSDQGDLNGGQSGEAADAHTGKIGVDTRILTAALGNPTFDQAGTPSGCVAVLQRYQKPATYTWDVVVLYGTDNTHGTGRAVTTSTGGSPAGQTTLEVGDVISVGVAIDTDTNTAFTSPVLTTSAGGVTFSAATTRLAMSTGVTTGNDGNLVVYEFTVTGGSGTGTLTLNLSGGPSQCGPEGFVRLRSTAPPVGGTLVGYWGILAF